MINIVRRMAQGILKIFYPNLYIIEANEVNIGMVLKNISSSKVSSKANIAAPANIAQSEIGDYTYISINSRIGMTKIGKFCSIGPNLFCGWGIHPTNGISTSPVFYSTGQQHPITFSDNTKVNERLPIEIGNDVFIGMNVTILDGVKIGNGAVIGAGAVVSRDIPPYAIAVGVPIKIIRYRFSEEEIKQLLQIRWWDFEEKDLKDVEKYFFDIDEFIRKYKVNQ